MANRLVPVGLGALSAGATNGWTSPYIAKLTAPECTHPLKLTPSEASWIASVVFFGRLIGAALAAVTQDFIGRKRTLLFMSAPLFIGWGLIIIAPTLPWLYTSRVFTGMAVGIIFTTSCLFLGEIADPMIRGSLIICNQTAMAVGSLMGTILGALYPMEIFSYVCLVLTGLFFMTFVVVPESPYYHITNGDIQKAEKSLKWFKNEKDVTQDIQELQDFLGTTHVSVAKRFAEFKKREHQKNLSQNVVTLVLITVFLYCAGQNATHSYAEIILTKSKVQIEPSVVVMALAASEIVAGIVALTLVDKFGRRGLLMASGLGLGVSHILLGAHFHMLSLGINPESISWLPVVALFGVYFSPYCGLCTVGDALLGELFPPMLKTPAPFVYTASSALMSFAISKSFQPYVNLVGEKYVFWTFATSALCSVVFSYFYIPETTQISLIDIQVNLRAGNKKVETPDD